MKFIVSSTLLLSHLQTISRVINSKNSMAILDNFLFRLEGTRLSMTASDQETTMTTAIDVMEAEGGCFRCQCENIARTVERVTRSTIDI